MSVLLSDEHEDHRLARLAATWPEKARAIGIKDQETYDQATKMLLGIKALRAEIEDHHKPMIEAALRAHRAAIAARKRLELPLEEAEKILKSGILTWHAAQEKIRRELEAQARLEAKRRAEEEALELAIQAESQGMPAPDVEAILEHREPLPIPAVAPTYEPAAGISTRTTWQAQVVDLKELALAVGQGKAAINLIEPNMTALNQMARAMQGNLNLPGVKAVPSIQVAARATRKEN